VCLRKCFWQFLFFTPVMFRDSCEERSFESNITIFMSFYFAMNKKKLKGVRGRVVMFVVKRKG
jgi:hypothetical protein